MSNILAAHAFDYIILRVKFGLTSCEELAIPLNNFQYKQDRIKNYIIMKPVKFHKQLKKKQTSRSHHKGDQCYENFRYVEAFQVNKLANLWLKSGKFCVYTCH